MWFSPSVDMRQRNSLRRIGLVTRSRSSDSGPTTGDHQKRRELIRAPSADPKLEVEYVSLLGSLSALERESSQAERREASLVLGAAAVLGLLIALGCAALDDRIYTERDVDRFGDFLVEVPLARGRRRAHAID